jgi:hypothetical protein
MSIFVRYISNAYIKTCWLAISSSIVRLFALQHLKAEYSEFKFFDLPFRSLSSDGTGLGFV